MQTKCVIFTFSKLHFMLTIIISLILTSCSSLSIYDESKYWTQFTTEVITQETLFITFSLPPGAKVINVPPRIIKNPTRLEYSIVSTGYFHLDRTFAEIYLTVILYNVSKYFEKDLVRLSSKLFKDHNIISHNSNLAWHKNQGGVTRLKDRSVLYRVGYSTGPNADQKLNNKVEDAYLMRLNEQFVLGVYAHQYDENSETNQFTKILPQMLEKISIRIL